MKTIELNNPIPIEDLEYEQATSEYIEIEVKKDSVDDIYLDKVYKKINDEKKCNKKENEDSNSYRLHKVFYKRNGNNIIIELEIS